MELKFRLWIEKDGEHVVGKGGVEILKAIEEEGSIAAASKKLGMSYRYVWGYLKRIESVVGKVVESEKGGSGGGRTFLTEKGKEIVGLYEFYDRLLRKLSRGEYFKVEIKEGVIKEEIPDGEAVIIRL
jgi:molybdate transport system regulatory protein